MTAIGDIARLTRVVATLRRTGGLDAYLEGLTDLTSGQRRWIMRLSAPLALFGMKGDPSLPPVSRALSALGPSHVKFGQVLSTRADIAGDALARDLRTLQDRLPPFSDAVARKEIEQELGAKIDVLFQQLDPPIAAASIAQVHPAVDREGRKVAVKVLRPGIERAFARDISAFYFVARLLERVAPASKRLKPTAVVRHFEGVVTREMDLRLEAAAGSEYGDNVKAEPGFKTPDIIWPLSSKRVLTTGWVDGTPLGDLAAIRARGLDPSDIATRIMRVFLRTALRDGYFHADMHQGNLKVDSRGDVVAFDFGIMGRIDARTRRIYAEILFSYLTRDYRRGAQAHFDAGYVPRDFDMEQFAQALRSIGEPIVGQKAADIAMSRVIQHLFDVTERFGMETRPELILLQRSMVVTEGVARYLDPNFNMWDAARPEVEEWMRTNLGPRSILNDMRETAKTLTRLRPYLPDLAERVIAFAERTSQPQAQSPPPPPAPSPVRGGGFLAGLALGLGGAAALAGAAYLGARYATEIAAAAPVLF